MRSLGRTRAPRDRRCHRGLTGLAIALTVLCCGCRPVRGNRLNILLVTIETTRADHLGAYGYSRQTSPTFDHLAADGVLFERHLTVSPRTNPSLASLMTAMYPHEHGVRNLLLPLEPENRTVAEVFRSAGYRTGAVQTHPRLIKASGMAQGFEDYDDAFASHPRADSATREAARWIASAARGSRPWFFWIHLMDPHWTYDPPEAWRTRYAPFDPRPFALYDDLRSRRATIGPVIFQNTMPPDEIASFVALYDAEINFTDHALGDLLEAVRRAAPGDRTLVVVSADHGESLGEHDYFFEHGDLGSQPEIHIPLVFRLPGRLPSGLKVRATERSIDVAPTLLDLAGLPAEASFRGTSLRPYLEGKGTDDRSCFGETDISLHEENTKREIPGVAGKRRWLCRGSLKLVYVPHAGRPAEWVLYDLDTDPGESRDVGDARPDVRSAMQQELRAWMAEDTQPERDYHIGQATREQLRSLGYVN